ncbi:MBL fold metallo-hydrolase [bacterium]|nr:MBL fold metallo-hydrolase [bacterium]
MMKIKNAGSAIIAGFLILSPSMIRSQPRESLPVQLRAVSTNIYEILEGRGARGGVFIGENGVLVIDAKMDEASVKQTLEEIGKLTDLQVRYLVNTHSDGDHVRGNIYFPGSVIIVSHENCRREFFHPKRDGQPSDWLDPELRPFVPSITFRDKMDIYLGSRKAELRYFGTGHTTGDAVVYFPDSKCAFIGDQIFMGRPQLIHAYKGGNSFAHVNTLTRMLETLDAEIFCSGHSDPVGRADIEAHIGAMKAMQAKVNELIEAGKSLEDIQTAFEEKEKGLVETIYREINAGE